MDVDSSFNGSVKDAQEDSGYDNIPVGLLKCTLCDIHFVSMFLLDKLKHLRQMICGFPELDFFMYFSPELQMNLLWIYIYV